MLEFNIISNKTSVMVWKELLDRNHTLEIFIGFVEFWLVPVLGCSGEPGKQGSADPCATGPAAAGGVPGGRRQVMEGEDSKDVPEEKLHILLVRGENYGDWIVNGARAAVVLWLSSGLQSKG